MAKKIRFPLEMKDGKEVRTLEELKEFFSIKQVVKYIESGRLLIWLEDRYYSDIADEIRKIDVNDSESAKKICELFGVEYQEMEIVDAELQKRLDKLLQYENGESYRDVVMSVAFEQDDLYDLLDEDCEKIYLCGESFVIPLSKKDVSYEGVNEPVVVIQSTEIIDFTEKGIEIVNCKYDEKYAELMNKKEELIEQSYIAKQYGDYNNNTYTNCMLEPKYKKCAKELYEVIVNNIVDVHFDADKYSKEYRNVISDTMIVGYGKKFFR